MVEVNITLETIKQIFRFVFGLGIGIILGMFLTLGVMVIMWFIPHFKDKLRSYRMLNNFRKSIPMATIECEQLYCKYKDDRKRCTKDDVVINSQGECKNWVKEDEA